MSLPVRTSISLLKVVTQLRLVLGGDLARNGCPSEDRKFGGLVSQSASPETEKPRLLFFYRATDGKARRAEGYLAQVLQSRKNHETFVVHRIEMTERSDLAARFKITETPALVVVNGKKIRARLERPRKPGGHQDDLRRGPDRRSSGRALTGISRIERFGLFRVRSS